MQWLEDQLRGAGRYDKPEAEFRHEVEAAWKRAYQWDGDPPRLADYPLGPDFLSSLRRVKGISRSKIIEVCVEVLTGRAETKASRGLHPLRGGEGADSTQRVRQDDGAEGVAREPADQDSFRASAALLAPARR